MNTPPKFNMEPENDGFQKESPGLQGLRTSGSMLNFRGVPGKNLKTNMKLLDLAASSQTDGSRGVKTKSQ